MEKCEYYRRRAKLSPLVIFCIDLFSEVGSGGRALGYVLTVVNCNAVFLGISAFVKILWWGKASALAVITQPSSVPWCSHFSNESDSQTHLRHVIACTPIRSKSCSLARLKCNAASLLRMGSARVSEIRSGCLVLSGFWGNQGR